MLEADTVVAGEPHFKDMLDNVHVNGKWVFLMEANINSSNKIGLLEQYMSIKTIINQNYNATITVTWRA